MCTEIKPIRFTTGEFANLRLNSNVPGQQAFWNDMMKKFDADPLFVLRFNSNVWNESAAGGYHWSKGVNFIDLPYIKEAFNDPYIVKDNTVTFPTDESFAIFMHECMHYEHLFLDNGMCISPSFEGQYEEDICCRPDEFEMNWETMRRVEYEAGYRAILRNNVLNAVDKRLMRNCQFWNIFAREMQSNKDLETKVFNIAKKFDLFENHALGNKAKQWLNENLFDKVGRYSAWSEANHDYPGLEEFLNE